MRAGLLILFFQGKGAQADELELGIAQACLSALGNFQEAIRSAIARPARLSQRPKLIVSGMW